MYPGLFVKHGIVYKIFLKYSYKTLNKINAKSITLETII